MECKRAQNLIDPYLDDELDPIHAMEVESHLHDCTACAGKLQSRKNLQQALRTKLPYYTAPASLRRMAPANPVRKWKIATYALAACLAIAVGGMSLTLLNRGPIATGNAVLAEAVESEHLRSLLTPEHLIDVVSSDKHTVKPWFVGKIPFAPPVPDLHDDNFELVGGRLDVLNNQTVAALVYRRDKHRINVFIYPSSDPHADTAIPAPTTTARGHHVLHWTCDGFDCWAISDMEASGLQKFAEVFDRTVGEAPPTKG